METVNELLNRLAQNGVKLSVEAGQLNCYAQKGALTPELRDGIVRFKPEIMALLGERETRSSAHTYGHLPESEKEFPLSAGQKGLYILDQLNPGMSAYNVPLGLKLSSVDAGVMAKAWDYVLQQFPILTARVVDKDGALYHRLDEGCRTTLQQQAVDFADDHELQSFLRKRAKEPFDLKRGPLTRIELFTGSGENSVLLVTVHHIVFDGTSAMIVLKSLLEFYQQLSEGQPVRLSQNLLGYRAFVAWEQAMLASAEGAAHASYWQRQLEGELPATELYPDFPRQVSPSFPGRTLIKPLPEDLSSWVREFARTHALPPSVIFLGLFQFLLHRYTNQDDVIVGMPVMGRAAQKFAAEVGYFINMVPLRANCGGQVKLIDFLRKVQGTMLDALYHSSYPFPLMLENLKTREREEQPIFRISYAYQNFIRPSDFMSLNVQALKPENVAEVVQEGYSELALEVFDDQKSAFTVYLKYNSDAYAHDTMAALIERYTVLLRGVSENPNRFLREYSILSEREKQKLLVDFNDTGAGYPDHKCLHELFIDQVARHPEKAAVIDGDEQLTYQQLFAKSQDLALYLRSQGVEPDSLVGLCMERSPDMVVGVLGILQAGGAYVPLDPDNPDERLAYMLRDSQVSVVLTQEALRDRLTSLCGDGVEVFALDQQWPAIADRAADLKAKNGRLDVGVRPHHLAYVIYTSGSTGNPKGVMVEHKSVVNYLTYCSRNYVAPGENVRSSFIHFPLTFDASVTSLFVPLLIGKAIDVNRDDALDTFKEGEFLGRGYDFVKLTPAHLLLLRSNADRIPAELFQKKNLLVVGGEALTRDHVEFLNRPGADVEVVNEYGPTEATVGCTTFRFSAGKLSPESESISIGTPIANTQIYILDRYGDAQPVGVPGELHIAGDGLARGYLNRPELTQEKFVANPFVPGTRMYRSGDLARWMNDGTLQYLGRIDTQVKIRGFRVELGEIEAQLNQHPQVQDSAVIVHGQGVNKQLVAFYRAKDTIAGQLLELPAEHLRAHLLRTLPDYMVPSGFVSLAAIPLNPNGKVDRRALERMDVTIGSGQDYVAPRNETERRLIDIWAEVLSVAPEKIGINDSFFQVGGHSLLATQLISKIRSHLAVDLPLKAVFERTTVAELAELVSRMGQSQIPEIRPIDRAQFDRLPLSFAQERLWFIHQLEPDSAGYNVPGAVVLHGDLDVDQMEEAFNLIIARHENLRTVFPSEGGQAHQRILDALNFKLERVDLSDSPTKDARDAEAEELCRADAAAPFDLASGPLIRGKVIKLAEHEHILMLNMHHIISDGWSVGVLIKELGVITNALRQGRRPELPPLPIQYVDYSVWQRNWLEESGILREQLGYWQEKLAGLPESLDLPTDYPRPSVQSFAGDTQAFALDAQQTAELKRLAEQQGGTLFMVLLAAFKALLHRYTGQNDICVGSPIANRQYGETEGLIGMFVNTLALRSQVDGDETFAALLSQVKATCLEAYEHQDAPFEKVVGVARPQRNMAISPIFQVMLILQNVGMGTRDQRIQRYPLDTGISKFDLTFEFTETPEGLAGAIEYSTALYRPATIARMVEHFVALCRAIIAAPTAKIHDLGYLGETERQRLLVEFNATEAEYPKDKCIHDFFTEQVALDGSRIAVVFGDQALTYQELYDKSRNLALWLQAQGVGPDTIVGLCVERSLEMMVGIMGTVLAGGAYMPLDPDYPDERLTYMLQDSHAPVVLTQEKWAKRIGGLVAGETRIAALDGEALTPENGELRQDVQPNNLCYVIYTSGSTGKPKGVLNEHQALVNRLNWMQKSYPLGEQDVVLQKTPYSFDVSVWEFFWPMMTGASIVFAAPGGHKDVVYLESLINESKVTTLHYVPSMLNTFLENASAGCRSVRQIFASGEALDKKAVDLYRTTFPNAVLHNLYGPTEAAIDVTAFDCSTLTYPFVPIGAPIDNIQIHILDRHNHLQPVGVPGELHIAGDGLARGYLNRPELTQERFVANPFRLGARMYKTGDLARWLDDGNIQYLGRIDTQVKIRGFRIELGEIEARLNQHPQIQDSAVVAQGEGADKHLVAFYRAKETTADQIVQVPYDQLRAHMQQTLPEYMVPAALVSLAAIPLSSNGKVDRGALTRLDVTRTSDREYVAPRNDTEARLAGIWAQILNLAPEKVGVHDNFFELGGHSLLATQLISKIRTQLDIDLPLKTLFERTSIAQLAELIATAEKSEVPVIRPIDRGQFEHLPLSFAQERLWFINQLEPESAGYNVPASMRISGELNVDELDRALNLVIERHESLRTLFPSQDGQARQQILEHVDFRFERIDLTHSTDAGTRNDEAARLCRADAVAPFDLANGPLIRGKVIKLDEHEHILMLNMHHIISDGWSVGVLINELRLILDSFRQGREPQLPPLPIQYVDYSVWQRKWLEESGALDQQLSYWQTKLADIPESLDLPGDYPRPNVQSYAGATQTFALDARLTARLKRIAEQQGGTLFMILLAAFKALLHRYTGQTDLCVGSPIANRQHGETEGLIGMFVNTLALRTQVDGGRSFAALLDKVKTTCLEAYENQDAPFEKVVNLVRPRRNMAVSPIFQVMLILQNAGLSTADQRIQPHPIDTGISKFDLTFEFSETAEGLAGSIEYSTALFKPQTVARMAEHFISLCEAITAAPATKVHDLAFLGEAEMQRLLVEFNDTDADYPKGQCLHQLFVEQVPRHADDIAVVFGDEHLTYGQLHAKSHDLALYLQAQGVGPDRLVGVCMERSLEMVAGLLGILQAGGAYVPLDPNYPQERLAYMVRDSRAAIVLTQERLLDKLRAVIPDGTQLIAVDRQRGEIDERVAELKAANVPLRQEVEPHHLSHVIYTSGSTGEPKGVAIEHHSPVTLVHWAREVYSPEELAGVLAATSICFDLSVYEIFLTLASGGTIILVPDALGLIGLANRESVTLINTVPSAMEELVRLGAIPDSVRTINLAGEPLPPRLVDKIYGTTAAGKVYDLYGPSEDTTYSTYVLRKKNGPQTIGRPIAKTQVYILDRHNHLQPVGVPGELHIAGDGLAREYLNRPELTQEKFVANPFQPGTRMYKTGDLARWLDNGTLQYLGRIDTQVKIRGFRIEMGEIEARLDQHHAIQESAVVAQGEGVNRQLIAFYRAKETTSDQIVQLPNEELRAHLLQTMPEFMVPAAFVSLAAIPLNPNGKVDRRALTRMDVTIGAGQGYVEPRNDTERRMVAIWAEVLDRAPETIGVVDDFFELGGHSLSAVQLIAKTNGRFKQSLPLSILFTAPNIAALAAVISSEETPSFDILVPIQPDGDAPPVFAVPGAGGDVLSLRPLSRALGDRQPLFGLQAVGLDGRTAPLTSVEETAHVNIRALKTLQPAGPYSLIGHSYGGVVAYEMARMLVEQGEEVSSLILLDSLAPSVMQRNLVDDEAGELYEAYMAVANRHDVNLDVDIDRLRRSSDEENVRYIAGLLNERGLETDVDQFAAFHKVYRANLLCYRAYNPAMLSRRINVSLYRATQGQDLAALPADYGWSPLLQGDVRIHDVEATHYTILEKAPIQRRYELAQSV